MKTLKFVWSHSKPDNKKLPLLVVLVVLYTGFLLGAQLLFSFVVDYVINGLPMPQGFMNNLVTRIGGIEFLRTHLWVVGVVLVAIYCLIALCVLLRTRMAGELGERFAKNVRDEIYDHLQKLPFEYHKTRDSGDLLQRCTTDINQIRRFLSVQLNEILYAVFMVGVGFPILFTMHRKLAFVAISLLPLIMLSTYIFYKHVKVLFNEMEESEAKMTSVLQENLNSMRVVMAFHQEKNEIKKYEDRNVDYNSYFEKSGKSLGLFWGISDIICFSQILLVILAGIYFSAQGQLTAGEYVVFITLISMIIWPLRNLGRLLSEIGKLSISVDRMQEVLVEEIEDLESGSTKPISGDIVFDHVSFKYTDGTEPVLKDVSFTIPENKRVAIMGPTGSGKSTLMYLLTGIYDYSGGSIKIGDEELRDINLHTLRKDVQIVLQEPFLFSKSIYENIQLANVNANKDDIFRVTSYASIHEDIMEFAKGYETEVGERGVTLSGGQKQRVAIARTLLAKSKVIIFDDSLSALDAKTDESIQSALNNLSYDVTTVMITHRIQTAKEADVIIVIDDGRVVQTGTHEQLIHESGLYQRVYEIQTQGGDSYE